jgi:hypothetical protein
MIINADYIIRVIRTKSDCGCNKIQYPSFRDAQEAINCGKRHRYINGQRMNRRVGRKDYRPVRSYKCDICGFWHLTSQSE